MTWIEPQRPRVYRTWGTAMTRSALDLAVVVVPVVVLLAFFLLHTGLYVALCAIVVILSLVLSRTVKRDSFPYGAIATLAHIAFGMLWFGVAWETPLPGEAAAAIAGGISFGLSSGSTGSIAERNLKLVTNRSAELLWATLSLIAVTALFGVVVPQFPEWASVAIGGSMIIGGTLLTWRAPRTGSPHIAIAMMTAAGVAGCILPFLDSVASPHLAGVLPWMVALAYNEADQRREERTTGRKRWRHPATARAAALRDAGAGWHDTLVRLEQEGFRTSDQVTAVRNLDGFGQRDAAWLVTFYRHLAATHPTQHRPSHRHEQAPR